MSIKTNTCGKVTTINKNSENVQQTSKAYDMRHEHVTTTPSKKLVLHGQCDTLKVMVKGRTKGQKRTSPVANIVSGQKTEKKRPTNGNTEVPRSWSHTFGEQNLLYMKKQSSKHGESKETEKKSNAKRQGKSGYRCVDKAADATSCKRASSPKKVGEKNSKSPCCSSILVQDRTVQCPENSDMIDRFAEFNPVYILDFLMKELKDSINKKDKETCEIFSQMNLILSRIRGSFEKPLSKNLEKELESSIDKLKEYTKQIKAMCELWKAEREESQSLIQKREVELHTVAETLSQRLKDATRAGQLKDESISVLQKQIKNKDRIISDLKMEVDKQKRLVQEYYNNKQYLTMENEKLLMLHAYSDDLNLKYKNTIKELQNQSTMELKTLHEAYVNEGSASSQISAIPPRRACSSPTSSSSGHFNKSWHDLSDVSSVDSNIPHNVILKEDAPVKDSSAHLELYSLLDGESSHTILFDQNQGHKERQNVSAKGTPPRNASKIPENITSIKSIVSDARKQDNVQNRIPVNVPSPLRDYPHPDWSDSSLPSVSVASNLDMIPSNDI